MREWVLGLSFALTEGANDEPLIARGLTCDQLNPLLMRGPLALIPGIRRDEGQALLSRMGKLAEQSRSS